VLTILLIQRISFKQLAMSEIRAMFRIARAHPTSECSKMYLCPLGRV
jgi:hypothetical protein